MNIFVLDEDPRVAAQMVCDKHCSKMIVESGQMLSTAHRMLDGIQYRGRSNSGKTTQTRYRFNDERENLFYITVHKYHPCTTWTMESKTNYEWHYEHFIGLSDEFEYRYGKQHLTAQKLKDVLRKAPENIPNISMTPFAQAMSHYPMCKVEDDAVAAYRNYYHQAKSFAKWEKGRPAPYWWEGYKGG
jgi:hypothetical protein